MAIYTAGFAEWTAERFFGELKAHSVSHLVDVRLNNVSQLAGFAKKKDLEFFLKTICGAEYMHEPILAPTSDRRLALDYLGSHWGINGVVVHLV